MKKNTENNFLYVSYEEDRLGGKQVDKWEWDPTYTNFRIIGVYSKNPHSCYTEEIEVPFDIKKQEFVYVVVVRYTTGSTFGESYGEGCIVGCYGTIQEANSMKESIETGKYNGPKLTVWTRYFEKLESVGVHTYKIDK